jgi:hypothetical protein
MWLADTWSEVSTSWKPANTHPTHIRAEYKAQHSSTPPIPEVGITESDTPRPRITIDTAKRVNKLAAMAEGG